MARDFSQRFSEELAAFRDGTAGSFDFASTVLHRLMFLYFLQVHGWLDGDSQYLARPLRNRKGSYYRRFLQPLLHNGLAQPRQLRGRDWGRVPYLGAGIFQADSHGGDIADAAFHRILAFFDGFSWSLDDPAAEVQPHLLGTLFEKHVNRRQTGTYYTPEDVTEYIARNTIMPWVLDTAFAPDSAIWRLPCRAPDRYIPDALRHGLDEPLPSAVAAGKGLDRIAPARFALPTESRRELLARRERCRQLRELLAAGKVTSANDLVTHNLEIRRLVLDAIAGASVPLLRNVIHALETITVVDPTCGSGAFLFAALVLLEGVWLACLDRMVHFPKEFRPVLDRVANRLRFIRASIVGQNLFGVDLRPEAVELCRLRLLLWLIAASKPGEEIGDLPNLGATIRVGDALDTQSADGKYHIAIGNPPYLAAKTAGINPAVRQTADCPDVYAWIMERAAGLLHEGGRAGMIVPLSLAFSGDFGSCREMLFASYGTSWFSSFARIPSALFAGDIRVRNTIHLGRKAPGRQQYTTRLHRWFEVARPSLFPTLEYTPFRPECWGKRIPRLGGPALARVLEHCQESTPRFGDILARRATRFPLYFKKTAYNWLSFCRRLPPCQAADGSPIPHTQFDILYFTDSRPRDLAFLLLNGKWTFAFWCILGDDFHAARWIFAGLPVDLEALPASTIRRLLPLVGRLESAMNKAISFKRNAGKRVGTYNLARCRRVTDQSDRLFAEAFGWTDAWPDVELLYRQVVKTEFEA